MKIGNSFLNLGIGHGNKHLLPPLPPLPPLSLSPFPPLSFPSSSTQWREVILLWLGRDDVAQASKEEFIKYLIEFKDGCGGFYSYQTYFLAAEGIAEFADCSLCEQI